MGPIINSSELELKEETVVAINRVAKVITGGRRFRFNSIVAVGDGKCHLGIGFGKANDVMSAVNKAKDNAKKNIFRVNLMNGTIPHRVSCRFSSSNVLLKPASPGTGIIAGAAVRAVMEQMGVENILTKITGSNNILNVVRATINALQNLEDAVSVAAKRGITIKEIYI